MLHEEVELYSCLTGKDGCKTPISVIGAYLDGYEKGKAEAQPELCEDAVSRKAVLDAIDGWKWACANSGHKETESDIKLIRKDFIELPPVTPKQKWIPVTERLPEIGEYVLCMIRQRYCGRFHVCHYVDKDKYISHPYFDWRHNGFPDVVAWMPLPKPWEGDAE